MIDIIWQYYPALLGGLGVTIAMSIIIWVSGLVIGTGLGLASYKKAVIGSVISVSGFIIASIPVLVILFWFHYPLQSFFGAVLDPFWTSIVVLSVINAVVVSGIIRDAGRNVPHEFIDAAVVHGIDTITTFWKIELPLILRHAIPGLLLAQVTILHMTLFASLISVDELFRTAQRINSIEYRPIPIYTLIGLIYLSISLPLNLLAFWLKEKYARDYSER